MNVREQLENALYERGFVKEFIEVNGTKLGALRKPGYKASIEICLPAINSGAGMFVIKSDCHIYSQANYIQTFKFKDNEVENLALKVREAVNKVETINSWHKMTFKEIADDLAKQIARVERCYKALDYNISADMLLINELQTMNKLFNHHKEVAPENDVEYFVNKGKTGELEPHEVYRLIKHTSETAPIITPFEKNGLVNSKHLFITEHADGNIVLSVCKSQQDAKNYDIKDVKFTNISVAMPQDVAKERLSIMAEKFKHAAMDLEEEIEHLNYISGNMQDITNKDPEYEECLPEDIEDEYEDELDEFEIEE